jgi:hypothetical protein
MIETRRILVPRGYFLGPMTLDEHNYEQIELLVIYTDATEERDILCQELNEYKKYMRNKNE